MPSTWPKRPILGQFKCTFPIAKIILKYNEKKIALRYIVPSLVFLFLLSILHGTFEAICDTRPKNIILIM